MRDQKHRDGRTIRATRFRRLVDAIIRRRQERPATPLSFPPNLEFWPFGQACLHESELASKRHDALAWLYRRQRQRRDGPPIVGRVNRSNYARALVGAARELSGSVGNEGH